MLNCKQTIRNRKPALFRRVEKLLKFSLYTGRNESFDTRCKFINVGDRKKWETLNPNRPGLF